MITLLGTRTRKHIFPPNVKLGPESSTQVGAGSIFLGEFVRSEEGLQKHPYLEDHPRTCKWLISMVIISPLAGVLPFPNGHSMAYKWW